MLTVASLALHGVVPTAAPLTAPQDGLAAIAAPAAALPPAVAAPGAAGPLMVMLTAGFVLAIVLGALAHRVGISPPVGYLLAGVILGPFTPGLVADTAVAQELAEIGVILLMFGVGLHFSFRDLLAVRGIAIPGAVIQIAAATAMGWALALALGWGSSAGLMFGLSLSVASTVVLLRALQERRLLEEPRGRIAIGWLIVEDLAMVLALVLIPVLAGGGATGGGQVLAALAFTVLKVGAFGLLMAVVGRRVIPWALQWVAGTGSHELFTLGVLAISLGVAFLAAQLFDVSFALGAFFAGVILGESDLSNRAARESLPLRDAFSVLFFVSVGMLFDPAIVLDQPVALVATVAIIVLGKSAAAYLLVRVMRQDHSTALTISASLAQIGEFSFILAGLGVALEIMPDEARGLVLAGAILSIMLNPLIFAAERRLSERTNSPSQEDATWPFPEISGHAIVVGFGRVGGAIGAALVERGIDCVAIDDREAPIAHARALGIPVVFENAAAPGALARAGAEHASTIYVAIPNGFQAAEVVRDARELAPESRIVARAHGAAEAAHLRAAGADLTVMAEDEVARGMLEARDSAPG